MTALSNTELLLIIILLQQALFGLFWLVAAGLRLARRPSVHWAVWSALLAGGLMLILLRGQAAQWLSVGVGNLLVLAALVTLRRGVQQFSRLLPTDREQGCVLALGLLSAAGTTLPGLDPLPAVLLVGLVIVWTLLRAAADIWRGLSAEFGRSAAAWCALPLGLLALLFSVRALVAVISPAAFQNYLQRPGADGAVAALTALVIALLLQANLIAMVLLRLVRRLQYQSDHDTLTGLLGRRPMEQRLLAESQWQRRFGRPFALLSIDIDHFKKINDRCGHAAGDAVLKRVAEALRAAARNIDSVARVGGEEFCVLLPGADGLGADGVAIRMLDGVRGLHHPEIGGAQVTVSIGLVVVETPAESMHDLQRRLDRALYSAKAAGRDRIERALPAIDGNGTRGQRVDPLPSPVHGEGVAPSGAAHVTT